MCMYSIQKESMMDWDLDAIALEANPQWLRLRDEKMTFKLNHWVKKVRTSKEVKVVKSLRTTTSTTFSQQILGGRLLLVLVFRPLNKQCLT